jgi:hypothetical protein
VLCNGHIDRYAYKAGLLADRLPFAELRARSGVSALAKAAGDGPDFSRRIRERVVLPEGPLATP